MISPSLNYLSVNFELKRQAIRYLQASIMMTTSSHTYFIRSKFTYNASLFLASMKFTLLSDIFPTWVAEWECTGMPMRREWPPQPIFPWHCVSVSAWPFVWGFSMNVTLFLMSSLAINSFSFWSINYKPLLVTMMNRMTKWVMMFFQMNICTFWVVIVARGSTSTHLVK